MQIGKEVERVRRINAPAPIKIEKPERRPEPAPVAPSPERRPEPAPVAPERKPESPERQGGGN